MKEIKPVEMERETVDIRCGINTRFHPLNEGA